ncbi:MAG TPA: ACT domain-containing protein [Lysobacter sp.]|nr:ACT domain-containing protein [Lysobacter sp.]
MPERDLARLLATLDAERRDGDYVYLERPTFEPALAAAADAVVHEGEAVSYVLRRERLAALDIAADAAQFPCAWLRLRVHSALDAVGLTAAFAQALASRGIARNVLAGLRHDHLLVPLDRADDALAALRALQSAHA